MYDDTALKWVPVANVDEVTVDAPRRITIDSLVIGVYRVGDEFFAISDICTHQFAYLSEGFIEDCIVECPLHQATFDLRSGKALSGPAKQDLKTFPTKVTGGQVLVAIE